MFKWLKRLPEEPLVYKLAREIQHNRAPVKAEDLISWCALNYGEKAVRRELDKMIEAGIVVTETLHWSSGIDENWIPYVWLAGQSKDQLAFVA